MKIRIDKAHVGTWTPERAALHQAFIHYYLDGRQPVANPRLFAVTSGPASGKAGVLDDAKAELADYLYVNTDDIRVMLPEFPALVGSDRVRLLQAEAGSIRDLVLEAAMRLRRNIILDALGGQAVVKILDHAEEQGYQISVYNVHRPVEEALSVARERRYHTSNASDLCEVAEETTRRLHDEARSALADEARHHREFKVYDRTGAPAIEQESPPAIATPMAGSQSPKQRASRESPMASATVSWNRLLPLPARDPYDEYTAGEFSGLQEPEPDFEEARAAVDGMFADSPESPGGA